MRTASTLAESLAFSEGLQQDRAGFQLLAGLLKSAVGLALPESEKNLAMLATRVGPILRERNLNSYAELYAVILGRDHEALTALIGAATTHTTEFFRESEHFSRLRECFARRDTSRPEYRVWCAAASSGQEVYTLAMTLLDALTPGAPVPDIKILGTDVDVQVLEHAARGVYGEHEMRGVPPILKQRFFRQFVENGARRWQVAPEVARLVSFAPLNLVEPVLPFKHQFDVVFCRNVMIYFDQATIDGVVARLIKSLRVGGHLFVGHSEAGVVRSKKLGAIASAAYRKEQP